ncbi:MAG TPA: hypothetical protein VFW03_27035 [Gemmatimonadaceae bacterium]|nr:hypothetical protein [Gemmatimonadaceae bacterium]
MHDDDGAALDALMRIGAEAAPVPAEDGVGEDARDGTEEFAVEAEPTAELVWKRQHKLSDRNDWQHVLHEIRGALTHSAAHAGRAKSAAFTAKRNKVLLIARGAFHPREAATEQAAVEVAIKLTAHE